MTADNRHGGPATPDGWVRDHFSAVAKLSFAVGAANALALSALLTAAGSAAPGAIALGAAALFIVSLSLSRRRRLHAALALALANTLGLTLVLQHRVGLAHGNDLILAALVVAAFLDRRPTRHLSVGLAVAAVLTAATLRLAALGTAPPAIAPAPPAWLSVAHQLALLAIVVAAAWSLARILKPVPGEADGGLATTGESTGVDGLTHLPSRTAIAQTLLGELARSRRSQRPISVLLVAVDGFGDLRERLGASCGDWVLVTLGNLLSRIVRSEDWVARWQIAQFLLLLPEAEQNGARTAAERIRAEVDRSAFLFDGRELSFTISVVTTTSRGEHSVEALTEKLAECLAEAQAAGGDQLVRCEGEGPPS